MLKRTALAIVTVFVTGTAQSANFVDLTGEKFKGKDSALETFELSEMTIGCTDGDSENSIISWKMTENPGKNRRLDSFSIHFEIYDRSGKKINESKFEWERNVSSGDKRVSSNLCWDHIRSIPGHDAIRALVSIGKYSTVKYWIDDIQISDTRRVEAENKRASNVAVEKEKSANLRPRQMDSCDLSLEQLCGNYSKNISFGKFKLGEKYEAQALAKEHKLLYEEKHFKMDNRYFFFRTAEAKKRGSTFFTIYTNKADLAMYLTWTSSKDSMPWHVEGLKSWSDNPNFTKLSGGNRSLMFGEDTTLSESDYYGVRSATASVGRRPAELKVGPSTAMRVWSPEAGSLYFETLRDCKSETKLECIDSAQKNKTLNAKNFKRYNLSKGEMKYSFEYSQGDSDSVTRHVIYESLDTCNRGREIQHFTSNENGSILQTSCAEIQTFDRNH